MRWLRSHGAPAQDVAVYLSDLRDLFHLPLEEEYCLKLDQMASRWSAPFYEYYSHNIHPDIHAIARWAIEPNGVHDPFSGGTSNQAEGLTMYSSNYGNGTRVLLIAWSWPFTSYYLLFCRNQPWQTRARQL